VNGQRGNPILLDETALTEILASDTNLACRHLTDNRPEFVNAYETANTHYTIDLDTPNDLHLLAERTGWRLEMPA
jgi:CTP:molybdopterin cytidylyltransferase MocA